MLDLHTHILPGMDDGSKNLRQSMKMLANEKKQGVTNVVLTPHFYAFRESPDTFLARRKTAAALLESGAAGEKGLPNRFLGAEVAFFTGMSRAEAIDGLCIGKTNALLVEMPFERWTPGVYEELSYLVSNRGICPIIAHVERYMWYQPRSSIRKLCGTGVRIQANTSFFTRWQTSLLAMHMLKRHEIHFIGSDCHNMKTRPPNMGDAVSRIEKILGKGVLSYMERMEQWLLEGV